VLLVKNCSEKADAHFTLNPEKTNGFTVKAPTAHPKLPIRHFEKYPASGLAVSYSFRLIPFLK
jgi:hypothetical protein